MCSGQTLKRKKTSLLNAEKSLESQHAPEHADQPFSDDQNKYFANAYSNIFNPPVDRCERSGTVHYEGAILAFAWKN
jgi:hypothetical protein